VGIHRLFVVLSFLSTIALLITKLVFSLIATHSSTLQLADFYAFIAISFILIAPL